jgi:hypothetical protein
VIDRANGTGPIGFCRDSLQAFDRGGLRRPLLSVADVLFVPQSAPGPNRDSGKPTFLPADKYDVVWFYERGGAYIRCETRDVLERPGLYELVIIDATGNERVERFASSESLLQRQHELESTLQHDGWQGPFGRFF